MEERFFKIAILVSMMLHAILFFRLYTTDMPEARENQTAELTYQIEKAKPKPPEPQVYADKVMALGEVTEAVKAVSSVPQPSMSGEFFDGGAEMADQFKMYERKPDKVKGLKVTKEVSVPMLKSEKINTPAYVTYYQIVRDRIRDRAYSNYTKLSVGEVYLTFVITSDGHLGDLQIMESRSQGNEFLRNVGLKSVQEAAPFPPFPADLNYPELTFNVQISFQYREEE